MKKKVQVSQTPTQSCDKEKSFTDVGLSNADLSAEQTALLAKFGDVFSNCNNPLIDALNKHRRDHSNHFGT